MASDTHPESVRPPVALGCFLAVAAVVGLILFGVFAIKFLESGANSGEVRLDVPEAYAVGSIEFIGAHNFFIVRLKDETFVALSDLDAANRANQARRCRVALVNVAEVGSSISGQMSAAAAGANAVFREPCNGAVYDIAGARLSGPGRNLDRFPIAIGADGHLVVDTSRRNCSERDTSVVFRESGC